LVLILSTIAALTFKTRQRGDIFDRLRFQRRRASGASTPPRSFSPEKKISIDSSCPDYKATFPPSRRCALLELAKTALAPNQNVLVGSEPSLDSLLTDPLPTTRSYDLQNDYPKYTPTGFSTEEIKAMGDFPAYDILSGVPLPEPYVNFDLAKAIPRPYRPFRWAYHQTMCRCSLDEYTLNLY